MHRHLIALLTGWLVIALAACGTPSSSVETPDGPTATPLISPPSTPTLVAKPVSSTILDRYVVRSGDTLDRIALRFDLPIDDLAKINDLANPNALQIGQVLKIPQQVTRVAPGDALLPDSEVVYSSAYVSFDVPAFANQAGGYLSSYREKVEGSSLTGPQIIQLVAERYSVGPRVLLALLEYQGGWVTKATPTQSQLANPFGIVSLSNPNLFVQASWAADLVNEGYYGQVTGALAAFRFKDRTRAWVAPTVNPGTVGIQSFFAVNSTWEPWLDRVGPSGFIATYRRLFGEPTPIAPLVPPDLKQPTLRLPWADGATWYYTGGPHSAWGDLGGWSAIDVAPGDRSGSGSCLPSKDWALAAAAGRVVASENGRVMLSLDPSGFQGTGWALLYMHMAANDRIAVGTLVKPGDRIGHPSCVGGEASASQLHFARMYNGQWLDPITVPFILSGWQVFPGDKQYNGTMVRGAESREAHDGRSEEKNAVVRSDALPAQ